eukprot:2321150-Pyramimonas_sp.AAC.1
MDMLLMMKLSFSLSEASGAGSTGAPPLDAAAQLTGAKSALGAPSGAPPLPPPMAGAGDGGAGVPKGAAAPGKAGTAGKT